MEQITVGRPRRSRSIGGFRLVEAAYAGDTSVPPHFHQQSNITIVLRGELEERAGRRVHECGPGSVVCKPAGTVHSNRFGGSDVTTFVVELPSDRSSSASPDQFPVPAFEQPQQYGWRHGSELAGSMLHILDLWRKQNPPDDDSTDHLSELHEELLILVASVHEPEESRQLHVPAWVHQVREYLDDSPTATVMVGDIARRFGVHPVYLARVFRRSAGMTMSAYVHRLRARRAAQRLAATSIPIAEIAALLGFTDQPHFCRVFKQHMGVTPGRYRRIVQNL